MFIVVFKIDQTFSEIIDQKSLILHKKSWSKRFQQDSAVPADN